MLSIHKQVTRDLAGNLTKSTNLQVSYLSVSDLKTKSNRAGGAGPASQAIA